MKCSVDSDDKIDWAQNLQNSFVGRNMLMMWVQICLVAVSPKQELFKNKQTNKNKHAHTQQKPKTKQL